MPDGSPDLGCGSYTASGKRPVAWLSPQIVIAYQQMVPIGAPPVQLGIIARQIWQNSADNVAVIRAVQGMAELDIVVKLSSVRDLLRPHCALAVARLFSRAMTAAWMAGQS